MGMRWNLFVRMSERVPSPEWVNGILKEISNVISTTSTACGCFFVGVIFIDWLIDWLKGFIDRKCFTATKSRCYLSNLPIHLLSKGVRSIHEKLDKAARELWIGLISRRLSFSLLLQLLRTIYLPKSDTSSRTTDREDLKLENGRRK